jgi:hypothetical protein
MNRRPLDPQNGGVGVFAAQRHSACRIWRAAACGLFGYMDTVWSPKEHEKGALLRAQQYPGGRMTSVAAVQGAIAIPLGIRPILIGLPGVLVAVATGVTVVLLTEALTT